MEKLYHITFTLNPNDVPIEVHKVALRGEFLFYKSRLTGHTDKTGMMENKRKYRYFEYESGMASCGGFYYVEMERNEKGIYETSLSLTAGSYPYQFIINPVPEPENKEQFWLNMMTKTDEVLCISEPGKEINICIPDPQNMPSVPTVSGMQEFSKRYVGTNKDSVQMPLNDPGKKGVVTYQSYTDIDGVVRSAGIYLPAGYDKKKTYPLIIVSHGGGENEAHWFHRGSLNNIMDNLIAQGRTKEAIVVTPNNTAYQYKFDDWNFEKIAVNTRDYLIPFIEKIYNVSRNPHERAFCGSSMGARTTTYLFCHHSNLFDYYGAFSGGLSKNSPYFSADDPHSREVRLMIGSGEEDIAYVLDDIGVRYTIADLKEEGIPCEGYFVKGAHDWFTFTQMFEYFAEHVLWT